MPDHTRPDRSSDHRPYRFRYFRIVWNPINWLRESPDQYPGGLPTGKPHFSQIDLGLTGKLTIESTLLSPEVRVSLHGREGAEDVDLGIPADRVFEVVEQLLLVYRRTHEHEFEGPDDGLEGVP